ncbi:chemokine-binding protein [Pseudocowpox virus]|uniref:Chemokine-binding protein n=1 Tax=Pseudocowpox virus TaxID=129726 RepID=D3IZR1_9POXV|nr:chemokine-binding protein [Pseudocowpox virus]ADC54015.1 chemokine-binding protein [Pseudocowpox virus]
MRAFVLLLALVGAFAHAVPMREHYGNPDSAEKQKFCLTHNTEMYAKFRLYMRIQVRHSPMYEPSNMCMLDLETSRLDTDDLSMAKFEANGINGSIALIGEDVSIPFSYIGVGFNPLLSRYVYVNVSSWSPWDQLTAELTSYDFWGLRQILAKERLIIQLGCDHQKFPEEPTPRTTPAPQTTPEEELEEEDYEYYDELKPTPPNIYVDRKRNPGELDFSLLADSRCIESVDLYVELKDACINYRHTSPLRLKGEHNNGEAVRKEIKTLTDSHTICSMNMNPYDK